MQQSRVHLGPTIDAAGRMPKTPQTIAENALSIGLNVTIIGAIHYDGHVDIRGTVQGEVRCTSLNVAKYGTVMGTIVADEVTVSGGVKGSIYANRLVLETKCDVEGEIYHRELSLEDGCYFDGKSRPHKQPLELAEPSRIVPPALPKVAA